MDALLEKLRGALAADDDIAVAAVFGSVSRGRARPESDLDIYVRLEPGVRWSAAREAVVREALERASHREVDLIVEDRDATSVILRRQVAIDGVPFLERSPGGWTSLRADAMVAYADLDPWMRRCGAGVRRRIAGG